LIFQTYTSHLDTESQETNPTHPSTRANYHDLCLENDNQNELWTRKTLYTNTKAKLTESQIHKTNSRFSNFVVLNQNVSYLLASSLCPGSSRDSRHHGHSHVWRSNLFSGQDSNKYTDPKTHSSLNTHVSASASTQRILGNAETEGFLRTWNWSMKNEIYHFLRGKCTIQFRKYFQTKISNNTVLLRGKLNISFLNFSTR